jgi:hypothetical protein
VTISIGLDHSHDRHFDSFPKFFQVPVHIPNIQFNPAIKLRK